MLEGGYCLSWSVLSGAATQVVYFAYMASGKYGGQVQQLYGDVDKGMRDKYVFSDGTNVVYLRFPQVGFLVGNVDSKGAACALVRTCSDSSDESKKRVFVP